MRDEEKSCEASVEKSKKVCLRRGREIDSHEEVEIYGNF